MDDKEKAREIYEWLLREYPHPSDQQQIMRRWKEDPSLENMKRLRDLADLFF